MTETQGSRMKVETFSGSVNLVVSSPSSNSVFHQSICPWGGGVYAEEAVWHVWCLMVFMFTNCFGNVCGVFVLCVLE